MQAKNSMSVAAPVGLVWRILTAIDEWPTWQCGVKSANLNGPLVVGTTFSWKTGGISIRSELSEVLINQRIGWTGTALGTKAVHSWLLEEQDGATLVVTNETLTGWLPKLMGVFNPNFLKTSLQAVLSDLKTAAEGQV